MDGHRRRGIRAPMVHLPYFLPDDWSSGLEIEARVDSARPYLAAAGRLVKMKGFQQLIPVMRHLPEVDLRIAGTGPFEPALRALAEGLPNVRFEGLLGGDGLAQLFHGAACGGGSVAFSGDVWLRGPRSVCGGDTGCGASRRRGDLRDGCDEWRRPGL